MNIPAQESQSQRELVNSCQLPSKWNAHNLPRSLKEQYELMGIKVIGETEGDHLFFDVILPDGWKKESTSHSMWNNLLDDKGRIRATFFYKGAFYDRSAHINFETRYGLSINKFLRDEERGHYELKDVKVKNPLFNKGVTKQIIGIYGFNEHVRLVIDERGYEKRYSNNQPEYLTEKQNVWIPKYKNNYDEYNNTPFYYSLFDCGKEFFTTKERPMFFKQKYEEKNHRIWWNYFQGIEKKQRTLATKKLNKLFPNWQDINAYWD